MRIADALIEILRTADAWTLRQSAVFFLTELAPKLSDEQNMRGTDALIEMYEKPFFPYLHSPVRNALTALTLRIGTEQISRRIDVEIALLGESKDEEAISTAAFALAEFAPNLSEEQITRGGDAIIAILRESENHFALHYAGIALAEFAPYLRDEQITRGGDALLAVLGNTQLSDVPLAVYEALVPLAPKLSDVQITQGRELLLKIVEKSDAGRSAAVETLLVLPPYLDAETRTRIVKVLEDDFRCDFVLDHLSKVAPQLDPPNGVAFSQNILSQRMDDDSKTVEVSKTYRRGEWGFGVDPLDTITIALPEARYIAEMLAHPGAVGDTREALLKRFEELVLYGGQHIFITEKPEEKSAETRANGELGGLTPQRSPEPPPRKFRTIHDAQLWIQQNWPDFKLDETPEVQWRGRK